MLAKEKRFVLCVTKGKAPSDVVVRVKSIMLTKGRRTSKLDQLLLEAELGCHMQTLVNRMVA